MEMTENEIIQKYKEAKNQKQQIQILADLNGTNVKTIRDILKANGIDVPEDKRFKDSNKTSENTQKNNIEVPESIKKILNERRVHLIRQIKQMQSEVDDINSFIGPYKADY